MKPPIKIVPLTDTDRADLIEDLTALGVTDPEAVVTGLETRWRITRHGEDRAGQPAPSEGQIWENRRSHRVVKVTNPNSHWYRSVVDYVVIDGSRGQKSGSINPTDWKSRFTYLAESQEQYERQLALNEPSKGTPFGNIDIS